MKKFLCALLVLVMLLPCAYACGGDGKISVTFDGNGGVAENGKPTVVCEITIGKEFVAPIFTRENFTFAGWDYKLGDLNESATLKAIWQNVPETNVTVTFDLCGGTLTGGEVSQTFAKGGSATPPTAERVGYDFKGWRGGYENVEASKTVTAIWSPVMLDVEFDLNGGELKSGKRTDRVQYGKSVVPPGTAREGYVFDGWDKPVTEITENAVFTAKWKPVENTDEDYYTVTFDLSDKISADRIGVYVDPLDLVQRVKKGKSARLPRLKRLPYPYRVKGWDGYTGEVNGDITVKAVWEEVIFNLTFDADGGTLKQGSAPLTQFSTRGKIAAAPEVEKTGYIFSGWIGENGAGAEVDVEDVLIGSRVVTTDCSFKAFWIVDENVKFNVTFDGGGGITADGKTSVTETFTMDGALEPPEFSKDGFELFAWSMPLSDIRNHCIATGNYSYTVKAEWRNVIKGVTRASFGGYAFEDIILKASCAVPELPVPDGEGFAGWYYMGLKLNTGDIWNGKSGGITLAAKWNTAVTFDSAGGSEPEPTVFVHGKPVPKLPVPTRGTVSGGDDYSFQGWFLNGKRIKEGDVWDGADSSVQLVAKWRSNWTGNY